MEANPRDRWRRKRFTTNLDRLLTERGLTRKAAAEKAGVKEQWLRRAVSQGIAWPDKRSKERLQKLADTLGLDDIERLWGRDFIVPPEPSSFKDGAAELSELMRRYVTLVGVEDTTLRGIVMQIQEAIRAHRHPENEQERRGRWPSKAEENPPPPQVTPQGLTMEERAEAMRRALSGVEPYPLGVRYGRYWAMSASKAMENAPPPQEATKAVENAPPPQEATKAVENAPPPQDLPQQNSGEEKILARTSARQRVAHVLTSLSPEQSEFFFLGHRSTARAERYVEDQLFSLIRGGRRDDNGPISAQAPEEAVRALIAEIVEDHDKASHTTGVSDSDHLFDEQITMEEKSLDVRHGEVTQEEKVDQWGVPLPVGSALEAEIASSLAEDRAAVRHVDDFLENLGKTPVPSGKGTYLEHIKRLGNPRSVAKVALRDAGGNTGKALEWIIDKVDKSIEGERVQADAMRQAKAPQGRKKAPATRKRSKKEGRPVEMSHEDFRRLVTAMRHEDGLSVRDIITALWDDVEGVSDWVRRTERTELTRMIRDIIAQHEPEDDGPVPTKFNYEDQDALEAGDDCTDPP